MTNEELIRRFENNVIRGDSFHHADHVRLAFAYLSQYPVLEALQKFANALKRFATAHGKTQLYNETITYAYFFLIQERMARSEGTEWEEFSRQNPDLLTWKDGILNRYYRETTLKSELARRELRAATNFMPQNYVPIFIFMAVIGVLLPITLLAAKLVRPDNPSKTKLMPYECGIDPIDNARGRYTVRYYIIAILFVVFDVETIFLFPWAVRFKAFGLFGLIEMLIFLVILIVGYIWVWKKGALEWV